LEKLPELALTPRSPLPAKRIAQFAAIDSSDYGLTPPMSGGACPPLALRSSWRFAMRHWPALLALLIVTGFVVLGTAEAQPQWLRAVGIDWWGLADAREEETAEQARKEQLDEETIRTEYTLRRRREVLPELLAGRLDLFSAAAVFQELNQLQPSAEKFLVRKYPQMSPDERACRHVLMWTKEESKHTPGYRELHTRLEAQLQSHLRDHGEVRLQSPCP
jgi:hypothetical protein